VRVLVHIIHPLNKPSGFKRIIAIVDSGSGRINPNTSLSMPRIEETTPSPKRKRHSPTHH